MPHIHYQFPIFASIEKVFDAISTPKGLDCWWCLTASGTPKEGETYDLFFGEPYRWKALVSKYEVNKVFEFTMTESDKDWNNSKVGFELSSEGNSTTVLFYHEGWPESNEHFRISSFCWAMYLRLLRRHLEVGEVVPYDLRLEV